MLASNSCAANSYKGVPPSGNDNSNSKSAHISKFVSKRKCLVPPGGELNAEQQLPPKKKCTSLQASTDQPADDPDQGQRDQPHDHILHSKQHPENTDYASSHHRHCMVMSNHTELSTEELQNKWGRPKRQSQLWVDSLPDSGNLTANRRQLHDELQSRVAGVQSKQQTLCTAEHKMSANRSSKMSAHVPAQPACLGNRQVNNQVDSNGERAPVQDVVMLEPQPEAQLRSPVTSQALSVHLDAQVAVNVSSDKLQVEARPDAAPVHYSGIASNGAALAVSSPATVTFAQQSMMAGLMYHFAATKGPSWLFG